MEKDEFIPWAKIMEKLKDNGIDMNEKYIKFAIDEISFPQENFECEKNQNRSFGIIPTIRRHGNRIFVKETDVNQYIKNLKEMSIKLTFNDVKEIVKEYQLVLKRSRKRGMRGQRNFTGKIEDEIRGKLAEFGTAKFCKKVSNVEFVIDFSLLEKGELRDEGDFTEIIKNGKKSLLNNKQIIAVKSTAGYFAIALPENEWSWPGSIYIAVRLHIDESFLLKLINKGLELEDLDLNQEIGWLEVFGFIKKEEMEKYAFQGKRLPGKYHASNEDWSKRNYIMHPMQLHRNLDDFGELLKKYVDK